MDSEDIEITLIADVRPDWEWVEEEFPIHCDRDKDGNPVDEWHRVTTELHDSERCARWGIHQEEHGSLAFVRHVLTHLPTGHMGACIETSRFPDARHDIVRSILRDAAQALDPHVSATGAIDDKAKSVHGRVNQLLNEAARMKFAGEAHR